MEIGEKLFVTEKAVSYIDVDRHTVELPVGRISAPETVKVLLGPILEKLPIETLFCISLNSSNEILGMARVAQGTIDRASVHPRELFRFLLSDTNASGCILVHNHPGGTSRPSREDITLTERMKERLADVGVRLLDHLVFADGYGEREASWVSIAESAKL